MNIEVEIPIRLYSLTNQQGHWSQRARQAKQARRLTTLALSVKPKLALPVVVVITRIGKRELDSDNLQSACKSVRDGVADWLGVDDSSELVTWDYQQESGEYSVRVSVCEMLTTTDNEADQD